jgi:hypothetical protein
MTKPEFVTNCDKFDFCDIISSKHVSYETHHYALFVPHRDKISIIGRKLVVGISSHILRYDQHSTHAEIAALEKLKSVIQIYCNGRKQKFDLYVVKITKNGFFGSSRPCYNCLLNLIKSNVTIRDVYYSTEKRVIVREKFSLMLYSPLTRVSSGYRRGKRTQRCKR